jgi:hypothetical protein
MPALLDELKAAYGRSRLFSLVTTDAGNTSCDVGGKLVEQGLDYFAQIKSPHGELHAEAVDVLGRRRKSRAHASYTDTQIPRARGQRQLRLRRDRDAPAGRAAVGRRWRGRLSDRTYPALHDRSPFR